jgi:putative copper resistance protein D
MNPAIAVEGSEEIIVTYALLARPAPPRRDAPPAHVEFLIDRQGWLRARWVPGREPGWSNLAFLLGEVDGLNKEAQPAPPPDDHLH